MASWTDGVDLPTGTLVTASIWNDYNGANGDLMVLKTHTHDGTVGGGGTLPPGNPAVLAFFGKWGL